MEERREGTHEPGRDIDANSSLDIRFFLFLLLIVSLNSSWSLESLVAACDGGIQSFSVTAEFHPAGERGEESYTFTLAFDMNGY